MSKETCKLCMVEADKFEENIISKLRIDKDQLIKPCYTF